MARVFLFAGSAPPASLRLESAAVIRIATDVAFRCGELFVSQPWPRWRAKTHAGTASILVDKHYPGRFQCTADRQIISRCHGGDMARQFSTPNRAHAYS